MNQVIGSDDEDRHYVIGPGWADHWHIDGFPQSVAGAFIYDIYYKFSI